MGYGILWLLHLAITIVLIAATCAWVSRCKNPRWPRFWPLCVAFLALLSVAVYVVTGAYCIQNNAQPEWLFWYGLSLTLVFLAGAFLILKRGLKDITAENSIARSWPFWKLLTAGGVLLFIFCVVLSTMETRIQIQSTNNYIRTTAGLYDLLPAKLPDSLNARIHYDQAGRLLETKSDSYDWFSDSRKADFDITSDKITTVLADHQDVLKLVRDAVERPEYCPYAEGGSNLFSWPLPKYSQYRRFTYLLSLSAQYHVQEGNLNEALEDLTVIEKVSNHLFQYPILISIMIAGTLDNIRIDALESILAHSTGRLITERMQFPLTVPPSVFPEYKRTVQVETQGYRQCFLDSVGSDSFLPIWYLNDIFIWYLNDHTFLNNRISTSLWRVFLLPSDLKSVQEIAELRWQDAESYEDLQNISKKTAEAIKKGQYGIITAIAPPSNYSIYGQRAKQFDARRSLAIVAFAATAYKNSTGAYPAKLEELVPHYLNKVPADPFDLKSPIQMKTVEGGLDLFSKGPDPEAEMSDNKSIHFYLRKMLGEK